MIRAYRTLRRERDEARAVAERQQERIRCLLEYADEQSSIADGLERDLAVMASRCCAEGAMAARQQHHLDLALAENRRLRAAIATMNPGAMLSACKRPVGSRLALDPVARERCAA